MDVYSVRQSIAIFMEWVRAQFPHTLVFHGLKFCHGFFYFGAHSQKNMEQQRKKINRWMRTCCQRNGCMILRHPQFIWSDLSLYRFDGVHLSEADNAVFGDNFTDCINNFEFLPVGLRFGVLSIFLGRALRVWQFFAENDRKNI